MKRIYDAASLQSNDSPGMICNRSRPSRSKSRMISLAFRCSSGLQLSMRCKMSMPDGFSCLILRYSVSPSTALYMEEKSMTGTVKVPSMSKTTPLKRVLVLMDMAVRWERGKGWGFGCMKGMHLKRKEGIVRYFGGRYFGGKGEDTGDESVVRDGHVLPLN